MLPSIPKLFTLLISVAGINQAYAYCEPEISYPPPKYDSTTLRKTFKDIGNNLQTLIQAGTFADTSFSLEISSSNKTLYSNYYHSQSLGGSPINGSSVYRIGSNTKLFTALGILQQEAAGKLYLDDEVTKYIPALSNRASKINWKGITIRSLLAQLSGIPDNYADLDLLLSVPDPSALGFPPLNAAEQSKFPKCGLYTNWTVPCTDTELNNDLVQVDPVFPPQKETSYSNVGFDLLGQVLANVSGTTYEDHIDKAIFKPLGLDSASFTAPDDSIAAKAPVGSEWGANQGSDNPGGGIYSSSSDMIKFLRWVLKNYEKITPTLNWFQPAAWSSGSHSFLGYPWEIMRTTEILPNTTRPITFYTKGGGLTDYYSYSVVIPQYDLAVFMVVAGDVSGLEQIWTQIVNPLVIAAEAVTQSQLKDTYAGVYASTDSSLNSSITFTQSDPQSLYISSWVSNSTSVLGALASLVSANAGIGADMYFQLLPTFMTRTSSAGHIGEVWRLIDVTDNSASPTNATTVWNDYCVANIDPYSYGAVPLNEVIFWRSSNDPASSVDAVTLSAFRVTMQRK
ncbi:beta-lactamase family protein [Penicillium hispanicum]|uniref:beta-lactamase family protein n=1 Tax=Penicillium hispanicum TaxID=1080232 RepID=UPI0025413C2C|nr:beta-lactamase family protein [Penicillium hispanicum]KAJ5574130.1 beta-lactamase family protein [Penicillium hispanicum]